MADTSSPDPSAGWLRASLGLAALAVLSNGDDHGYALAQRITALGLPPVRGGTLYPVLGRLEAEGAVAATWQPGDGGPGKKVYAITDAGRHRLHDEIAAWESFSTSLHSLLTNFQRQTS